MGCKKLLLLVLLCVSFSHYYGVNGARRSSLSSNGKQVVGDEEDSELLRELSLLNKPSIKSVQTELGDIYDCVDIHKQPAFDHPALKNHKIQMRPTSSPQTVSAGTPKLDNEHSDIPLNRIGCPDGSVPIRRIDKEYLKRAKSFPENESHQLSTYPGTHRALLRVKPDVNFTYFGLSAVINIYNPFVRPDHSSTAQLWVEQVSNDQFNSLQAGWMVAPALYNDTQTHLFANWRVTGEQSKGCYNILCPGFVQISKDFPVGINFASVSKPDGQQLDMSFTIVQDGATKNWLLRILGGSELIGYWPGELVPILDKGAPLISWGGVARGDPYILPLMGSGLLPDGPDGIFNTACYMEHMKVNVYNRSWDDPDGDILESVVDNTMCYDLRYYGYVDGDKSHTLEFGGPGSAAQLCHEY